MPDSKWVITYPPNVVNHYRVMSLEKGMDEEISVRYDKDVDIVVVSLGNGEDFTQVYTSRDIFREYLTDLLDMTE
jgi:hypothetical protein